MKKSTKLKYPHTNALLAELEAQAKADPKPMRVFFFQAGFGLGAILTAIGMYLLMS